MTPRESECLRLICGYIEEHGYSPSFEELMEMMGLKSKSRVARIIDQLEEKGFVTRAHYRARGVVPVNKDLREAAARVVAHYRTNSLSEQDIALLAEAAE